MRDFVSLDLETGNPMRVSACALGYARVVAGKVVETQGYLIKPVGGHAPFQSKIHGITDAHTFDKPDFGELFPEIRHLFAHTLVAHSLFDQQVLRALSDHFRLSLAFEYIDTSALAKKKLPNLENHKLKTLAKHFHLPKFRHHDAKEDALACASICLKLHEDQSTPGQVAPGSELYELRGMIAGILADDEVNYKEAFGLLYWLEDRAQIGAQFQSLHDATKTMLEDENLDSLEANELKDLLRAAHEDLSGRLVDDGAKQCGQSEMSVDARDTIEAAIAATTTLTIRYAGGSQPGTTRQVQPIAIQGESVSALCLSSGIEKTFRLSKIEVLSATMGPPTYNAEHRTVEPTTLGEVIATIQTDLEAMGWVVVADANTGLSVYRRFKNGSPRKTPDVTIQYFPTRTDLVVDETTGELVETNERASARPWYVRSSLDAQAASFAHLSAAAERFVQRCREAAAALL